MKRSLIWCRSRTTGRFEPDWAWALYLGKGATGVGQKRFAEFSVWAVATWIVSSHAHTPFTP